MGMPQAAETKRSSYPLRRKICVNGDLGSGKTTAARTLAELFGYEFYSIGQVQRQIAEQLRITTLDLNRLSETDRTIDDQIDGALKKLADDTRGLVIDSRMGWYFVPHSLKIRLVCHPLTSATRLFNDTSRHAENYQDIDQAISHVAARRASERKRFSDLYNVSVEELSHYNLIVQTDLCSRTQVVGLLTAHINGLRRNANRLVLSPRLVFPLDHVRTLPKMPHQQTKQRRSSRNQPIDVIYADDCFFVVDGHKRLAAALSEGLESIVARLVDAHRLPAGIDPTDYVRSEISLSRFYDWEGAFEFKFPFYPRAAR